MIPHQLSREQKEAIINRMRECGYRQEQIEAMLTLSHHTLLELIGRSENLSRGILINPFDICKHALAVVISCMPTDAEEAEVRGR